MNDILINASHVCYLFHNTQKNEILIGEVLIQNEFDSFLDELRVLTEVLISDVNLYHSKRSSDVKNIKLFRMIIIDYHNILTFISGNANLNLLSNHWNYCQFIDRPYQDDIVASNKSTIESLTKLDIQNIEKYKSLNSNSEDIASQDEITKINHEIYTYVSQINEIVRKTTNDYCLWSNAFSIDKVYNQCSANNNIIAFSHKRKGWSKPLYNLTNNFTVQIKTNFGYGNSSYFYTVLTYKGLSLAAYSDLITYEFAHASEIIKYTKSYPLIDNEWINAMTYCKEACNLTLIDEESFFSKYVIDECQNLVNGLDLLVKSIRVGCYKVSFIDSKKTKELKGHSLYAYIAVKIADSLMFIADIVKFKSLTNVKIFIEKILLYNKNVLKLLTDLLPEIEAEVLKLKDHFQSLSIEYESLNKTNSKYETDVRLFFKSLYPEKAYNDDRSLYEACLFKFKQNNSDYVEFLNTLNSATKILNKTRFDIETISKNIEIVKDRTTAISIFISNS